MLLYKISLKRQVKLLMSQVGVPSQVGVLSQVDTIFELKTKIKSSSIFELFKFKFYQKKFEFNNKINDWISLKVKFEFH